MKDKSATGIRLRIYVDPEMPDLYQRLQQSTDTRRSREVVHLLRMGIMLERVIASGGMTANQMFLQAAGQDEAASESPPPRPVPKKVTPPSGEIAEPGLAGLGLTAADFVVPQPA